MQLVAPASRIFAEEGSRVHVVARGENLFRIALRYGVPMRQLAAVNGIGNLDVIAVGQRLVIPALDDVAGGGQIVPLSVASLPQTSSIAGGTVYVVRPGENLTRIAQRYGLTAQALARANNLANPDMVEAGRALVIPNGVGAGDVSRFGALTAAGAGGNTLVAENVQNIDFSGAPTFRLTHYCLYGQMASTRWVYSGAVAADASIFPLGTRLLVEGLGLFTVEDRFAWDANEARLDLWVPTCSEALTRGVQFRRVLQVRP